MIREQSHQALILFHIHQAIVDHCAELLWLTIDSVNEGPGGNGHNRPFCNFHSKHLTKESYSVWGGQARESEKNKEEKLENV